MKAFIVLMLLAENLPTPDLVAAVTKLLEATSRSRDTGAFSSDRLHAVSEIIGAIAWPSTIIIFLFLFRIEMKDFIGRIKKLGIGGTNVEAEEKIEKKVASSEAAVLSSTAEQPPAQVTSEDVKRSSEVALLSKKSAPEWINLQVDQISAEYEGIRANMPSSPERTKRMGAVMAKMRTLGRAAYPLRKELSSSASAGKRLFAVAVLQMMPDYTMLEWLSAATSRETPYVQFQALNALLIAVRNGGPQYKNDLIKALDVAVAHLSHADPDQSRIQLARMIQSEIDKIPLPIPNK